MKSLFLATALCLTSLMTACQTAPHQTTSGVTCSKCQTVWVKSPQPPAAGVTKPGATYYMLKDVKTMICPDCSSAVMNFFKTGKLKHACSHCGGTLTTCCVTY